MFWGLFRTFLTTKLLEDNFSIIKKQCILTICSFTAVFCRYRKRIKEVSAVIYDQPMTGIERSVWWIEHIIRTKGARYLRSPALDIPAYQYYFLDVIGISVGISILVSAVMYKVFVACLSYLSKSSKNANKRKKKSKTT